MSEHKTDVSDLDIDTQDLDLSEVPADSDVEQTEHDHGEVQVPEWDGADESVAEDEDD